MMNKLLLLLIVFSINAFSQSSSGSWTQLNPPNSPSAREYGVMSRISDTEVLLFGGNVGWNNNETWKFNISSGSWTQLNPPNSPSGRQSSMMARISDNELLLFGGYDNSSDGETWKFNISSGSWTQLNPPNSPSSRYNSMVSRISDDEILLFGGYGGNNLDETWIFNNSSGSWTQLNPPISPSPRYVSKMARISDDEILLFGGWDGSRDDETWIFNNSSGSWTQLNPPNSPGARSSSMMARISDDEVLLFGGDAGSLDDETWIFNNSSGSWTQLNPPNSPDARRSSMMARISDNKLLLFGGYDGSRDDETWIFELETETTPSAYNPTFSNFTTSSASYSVEVADGGASTTVTFEYGTGTGDYSATTTSQTITGASTTSTVNFDVTGLDANEQYFVRARAENSVSFSYSTEASFWTLTDEPTTHTNSFAQVGEANNSISFSFQSLNTISADGYILLRSSGNIENPVDGNTYSVDDNIGSTLVVGKITDTNATDFVLNNQQFQKSYTFKLVPFNVGDDPATTNYFITVAPTINAYTIPTLGEWGMMTFVGLMAIGGVIYIRKRII